LKKGKILIFLAVKYYIRIIILWYWLIIKMCIL